MPNYTLEYSAEAFSQLESLDKAAARRVVRKIESTLDNPRLFFKRLVGRPEYKLRVGDYRAIADIDEGKHLILIRAVGHRKNIYERA